MTHRSLRILSAVFAFAFFFPAASPAQTNTYTVSGAAGGTWTVDDNLNVYSGAGITGPLLYTTGNGEAVSRGPFTIQAKEGDQITDQVIDTFGHCTGLTPLYLSCNKSTPVLVDPGLPGVCGRPGGNQGESYRDTYTIPAIAGCGANPIAAIEFTQAIQQYQTLAVLKASLMANNEPPVPMIAGKPGVMRLYFASVTAATTYNVLVVGPPGATKSIQLPPGCQPADQRARNNPCSSLDFYFTAAPTGAWTVSITVTDDNNVVLEQEDLNLTSRTTSSVQLTAISGCVLKNTTNQKACGSASALLSQTWLASLLMPTASVTASTKWASVSSCLECTRFDYTAWDLDLARQAAAFYSVADQLQDAQTNQWTDYFAVYPASSPLVGDSSASAAGIPSHGIAGPDFSHDIGVDDTAQTVAHEIAHTLSLKHTGVVVSTKAAAPPGCWATAVVDAPSSPDWPYPTNNIQSSGGVLEDGFNVTTQTVLDPSNTFDLMAYCFPEWIAPFEYKKLITQLNGGVVASPSNRKSPVLSEAAPLVAPPAVVTQPYWQIGGSIDPVAGVTFDPIFAQTLAGTTDAGTGTYSIQVLGAGGQVLYTRNFTPLYGVADELTGSATLNPTFSEWVPVATGAASFAVMDPNGNTVGTVPVTGAAPTVTITSPGTGFVGSNTQTISWTIVDPDSTAFTSRVLYSPDGGTTWGQVSQTTWTSDTLDFSQLPGSPNGMIQVLVSDGVNTGSATSAPFNAPKKTPSTIVITSPASGYTQAAVDPLFLSGAVWDADDGVLTGTALQWSDNVQGALGSGSPLSVTLQPGPHTITLTGTDSDGNAITATTSVTMAGKGPALALTTTTLSTNCVRASIAASPGSQGAALSLVQYSLDGGSTYTSIPLNALPYSFVVPGSTGGTVVAVAQDASRQTAAQSAVVSLTGACTAGAPTLFGGSPQTTTVGSSFATPLSALVTDVNGNPSVGVTVNFTAPATGASATITPATAITGANGVATATAKANGTNGNYTVVASVSGFSGTAQFTLTNTDFSLALSNSSLNVQHGSEGATNITIAPLSGFNAPITFTCANPPAGVTCAFSPATLTPAGSPLSSALWISVAGNAKSSSSAMLRRVSGGSLALALCLLVPGFRRRKKRLGIFMFLAVVLALCSANGCGSSFHSFSSSVAVTATSGSLSHTQNVTVVVQ